MKRKMVVRIDWTSNLQDINPSLECYKRHLGSKGLKSNRIKLYIHILKIYLTAIGYDQPSIQDAFKFSYGLQDCQSRSARDNYSAALGHYHAMTGKRTNDDLRSGYTMDIISEDILIHHQVHQSASNFDHHLNNHQLRPFFSISSVDGGKASWLKGCVNWLTSF